MSKISYQGALDLASAGQLREAEAMCNAVLAINPKDYLTLYLSASIKLLTLRYEECRVLCGQLRALHDNNADVFNMLAGIAADYDGDDAEAEKWLRRALECDPGHRKALVNLGNLFMRKQRIDDAYQQYQTALKLGSGADADALNGLGMIAANRNDFEQAIEIYREALKLAPNDRNFLTNLISTLYTVNRPEEAIEISLEVATYPAPGLAAVPAFACAKSHCLWDAADALRPTAVYELCELIKNYHVFMLPNMAMLSTYEVSNAELHVVHCRAAESMHRLRVQPPFQDHPKAFLPGSKIRLAYLSPDLKSHVVGHFFRGLVNHRDRGRFELYLYSNLDKNKEDAVTEQYRMMADHFISVHDMSDVELAERIHSDGIQILVELSGYTTGNRLAALSYKPAPVQIAYLGYPFSYGMPEFDYHISDPWLDGPENASYFVEQQLRMPQSFLSFGEMNEQEIEPEAPHLRNGFITFGSLNNSYKLNRKTIELWSRILAQIPSSRIYLNHPNYKMTLTQAAIFAEFAKHGISPDRVSIVTDKHPSGSHLRYYNEMDIMLDSMPLSGGTTTVEALWMGVPVITKVGDAHPQRMSYSIIKNVGIDMDDCIAFGEDEYVERSVALALNVERLDTLRRGIPRALQNSILCNPVRFTAQIENVFIEAWNRKFPETPIESLMTGQAYTALPVGNADIVLRDAYTDMHTYILREQQGWFEPEASFLELNARLFKQFWDFSEDPGVFAVPVAAAQKDKGGHTLAMRSPGMAAILLGQSATHNQLDNLETATTPSSHASVPDLVRFSLDLNDGMTMQVAPWLDRIEAARPLVLASLRNPEGVDHSTMQLLLARGYQAYRLLPGYNLLVPYQVGDPLEPSDINLFFCMPERAQWLEEQGVLASQLPEIEQMPLPSDSLWVNMLAETPYAARHLPTWQQQPVHGQWGDMYLLALNLYAGARDARMPPGQRFARIKMLDSMYPLLLQGEATASRLLTGIRLMGDSGRRQLAVQWANVLVSGLPEEGGAMLDEPALAPGARFEGETISDNETLWMKTAVSVVSEQMRSFSSWFTISESLAFWKSLLTNPLMEKEAQRMVRLIELFLATSGGPTLMGDFN